MTSTHYNDMGSLSASSGQRTQNCVTSNSNLIFSICNFVHKQRQLCFFFSQSQFQQQTQSRFKIFEAPPPWTADSELCHQRRRCCTSERFCCFCLYCCPSYILLVKATKNTQHTKHTHPAATTYCSSNPHKNLQNIHMLLLKFSKISMLLQFVQIHTNSNLLKPSARLRAQKNPTSNPQSRCVQLLCYRGTHTNSIIANCTFIAHFEGTGS